MNLASVLLTMGRFLEAANPNAIPNPYPNPNPDLNLTLALALALTLTLPRRLFEAEGMYRANLAAKLRKLGNPSPSPNPYPNPYPNPNPSPNPYPNR